MRTSFTGGSRRVSGETSKVALSHRSQGSKTGYPLFLNSRAVCLTDRVEREMSKRGFSDVQITAAQEEPDEADVLASKWLLTLASAPVKDDDPRGSPGAGSTDSSSRREGGLQVTQTEGRCHRAVAHPAVFPQVDVELDEPLGTSGMCDRRGQGEGYADGELDDDTHLSSPRSPMEEGDKKRIRAAKSITLDELRMYFDKPIEEAAKTIGICSTLLKKICRRYNIKRWPYRQVMSQPSLSLSESWF
jgi:hypothetical protein